MSKPSASNTESRPPRHRLGPLAAFAVAALLASAGLGDGLDRSLSDLFIRWRLAASPLDQSPSIVPVDLNDRAERNLGDQVDNRQAFADLFTVLGEGHLSGAMDFLFQGKKDAVVDKAMAQAAAGMDNLVLAVVPVPSELSDFSGKELAPEDAALLRAHLWHPKFTGAGSLPSAATFLMPNRDLAHSATHLAHIGVTPDSDGLYRRVPLFYRWEDGVVPSLSLALAAAELKIDPSSIEVRPGTEVVLPRTQGKAIRIPIDDQGYAWVPFPSSWNQGWKRIPLDKVVAAAGSEDGVTDLIDQWTGTLVIAADLTTGHKDFGSTPVEAVYPLSGIHTSLLNGILTGQFYRSTDLVTRIAACLILLGLCWFAIGCRRDRTFHGVFAALAILVGVTAIMLWWLGLVLPWVAAPACGLAAAWIAAWTARLFRAHEERLLLENALTRYFPRALAARVLSEKRTDLKPASKDLTILFADIAGFTKWSSDKESELVHRFLSDYLESMAAILFDHGGTVDKFMGDGILAFFNDPWEQPDHAARCLRASLAMQAKARELKEKWAPVAGIDLKVRIGINTGRVIVGNLGSLTRIEYTVIGASVNLAQRMEGNAPLEGILVARDTWALTKDKFRFGAMKAVQAKGYERPVEAYVLEGEDTWFKA